MNLLRYFRRRQADIELQHEIAQYLEEEIEENRSRGMSPGEARRQAILKFGNPLSVRESLWRQNTISAIDWLWRDLRYAARTLIRTPGFAAAAIMVMALGVGANVALFTVVRSVLLKPLPYGSENSGNRHAQKKAEDALNPPSLVFTAHENTAIQPQMQNSAPVVENLGLAPGSWTTATIGNGFSTNWPRISVFRG